MAPWTDKQIWFHSPKAWNFWTWMSNESNGVKTKWISQGPMNEHKRPSSYATRKSAQGGPGTLPRRNPAAGCLTDLVSSIQLWYLFSDIHSSLKKEQSTSTQRMAIFLNLNVRLQSRPIRLFLPALSFSMKGGCLRRASVLRNHATETLWRFWVRCFHVFLGVRFSEP